MFYRRCYVKVEFDGVREVAGIARTAGVLGEEVKVGADGEVSFGGETEKW